MVELQYVLVPLLQDARCTKIVDDLLGRFKRYRLHMIPRSACFVLFLHAREERRVVQRHSCRPYTSTVSSSLSLTFLHNLLFISKLEFGVFLVYLSL